MHILAPPTNNCLDRKFIFCAKNQSFYLNDFSNFSFVTNLALYDFLTNTELDTIIQFIYIGTIMNFEGSYNFTNYKTNPKHYCTYPFLFSQTCWLTIFMKNPTSGQAISFYIAQHSSLIMTIKKSIYK